MTRLDTTVTSRTPSQSQLTAMTETRRGQQLSLPMFNAIVVA